MTHPTDQEYWDKYYRDMAAKTVDPDNPPPPLLIEGD